MALLGALLTWGIVAICAFCANPSTAQTSDEERGRYLAAAGNCVSCHTRPGGDPFAGGVAFEAPYRFLGTIYSTNITPDRETGIGDWSEEQFIRAMREGIAPDGAHLFPAFPYTAFTKLSDFDVKALYAYLRTLEPVRYTPPENGIMFHQRWGMALWNALFFRPERFDSDPSRSSDWNRGAYLVEGLGHCGSCHTPRNLFLAERKDRALSGASYPDLVTPGKIRIWSAADLTSGKSGLGHWSDSDLRKYLQTGHNPKAGLFGPMSEVIGNSLRLLTSEDIAAIATYLKSLNPGIEQEPQHLADDQQKTGEAVYGAHCEKCHLASGRGGFLKAPPVSGSAVVQAPDPASLINVILYGAAVPPDTPAPAGAWESMPGYQEKLSDKEIAALVNYLRTNFGNIGTLIGPRDVSRQR